MNKVEVSNKLFDVYYDVVKTKAVITELEKNLFSGADSADAGHELELHYIHYSALMSVISDYICKIHNDMKDLQEKWEVTEE